LRFDIPIRRGGLLFGISKRKKIPCKNITERRKKPNFYKLGFFKVKIPEVGLLLIAKKMREMKHKKYY
jgi:hypothetical protein